MQIAENNLIPTQNLIYETPGHKVMPDSDLTLLSQVPTRALNLFMDRINRSILDLVQN